MEHLGAGRQHEAGDWFSLLLRTHVLPGLGAPLGSGSHLQNGDAHTRPSGLSHCRGLESIKM